MRLAELYQAGLSEVWVVFDLQSRWRDACVAEEINHERSAVVGYTNRLGQTLIDELFHSGPSRVKRSLDEADLVVLVVPSRRVADAGINVFERNGKVDQEEIKVVDSVVFKLLLANGTDTLFFMERVPQLGNNEELLALDETVLDGAGETFASFLFVSVVLEWQYK